MRTTNRTARPRTVLTAFAGLCCLALLVGSLAADPNKDTAKQDGQANNAANEEGQLVLFNGKDLTGWTMKHEEGGKAWSAVGDVKLDAGDPGKLTGEGAGEEGKGAMLRGPFDHGSDIYTEQTFGDCELHVEFMVPKGSNSGVYLQGQYEVQVLDSHGKTEALGQGDVGAIYSAAPPSTNATKAPGEWQEFHIVFQAPRFDANGVKTQNAKFISVDLNGTRIQENVEVQGPTGGQLDGGEKPEGPLMFQGDHGIVAYRNVRWKPIDAK